MHVIQHSHAGSPLNMVKEILTASVESMATVVAMQVRITTLLRGSTRSCQPKWTMSTGIRKRMVRYSLSQTQRDVRKSEVGLALTYDKTSTSNSGKRATISMPMMQILFSF